MFKMVAEQCALVAPSRQHCAHSEEEAMPYLSLTGSPRPLVCLVSNVHAWFGISLVGLRSHYRPE